MILWSGGRRSEEVTDGEGMWLMARDNHVFRVTIEGRNSYVEVRNCVKW